MRRREMPISVASCSWVNPCALRSPARRAPKLSSVGGAYLGMSRLLKETLKNRSQMDGASRHSRKSSSQRRASSPIGSNSPARWLFPRSASTRPLYLQQSPLHQVQIGERRAHLQPVQILGKPAVAGLAEAKYPLDHPDRVLDLGTHLRLGPVLRLLSLVEPASAAIPSVREVLGARRPGTDHGRLSLITLIAPDSRLTTMQQVGQRIHVRDVRCRGQYGVDQLALAIHSHMRLHPEVPLLPLARLVHLGVALPVLVLRRA